MMKTNRDNVLIIYHQLIPLEPKTELSHKVATVAAVEAIVIGIELEAKSQRDTGAAIAQEKIETEHRRSVASDGIIVAPA